MADEPLRLDQHLCFALYNASRAFTRAYASLLAPLELTYPQYLAMLALWEQDGRSVGELGGCLALDSGTLTPLLKRLEQRGLVRRVRDPQDERAVRVHLTPSGSALRAKAKKIPQQLAAKAGFDLTSARDVKELVGLRDRLAALTAVLDEAG